MLSLNFLLNEVKNSVLNSTSSKEPKSLLGNNTKKLSAKWLNTILFTSAYSSRLLTTSTIFRSVCLVEGTIFDISLSFLFISSRPIMYKALLVSTKSLFCRLNWRSNLAQVCANSTFSFLGRRARTAKYAGLSKPM